MARVSAGGGRRMGTLPVLEPDLYRALSHVDLLRDALANDGSGSGVLVELHLQRQQLFLGGALALLVLLLLGQGALARGAARRGRARGRLAGGA